jgi:ABC-type branched-subunit amino acid transport system ATPase component
MTSGVVLQASDVAMHFGGVKAVDGVSFTLTEGTIFGIMGANGSGKSTLLGALTRLTPLTRGELTLDGERFDKVSAADVARRRVARTFQTVRLLPDLTVLENIQHGGDLIDTCDCILSMNFGRLIAEETPEAAVRDPAVR